MKAFILGAVCGFFLLPVIVIVANGLDVLYERYKKGLWK